MSGIVKTDIAYTYGILEKDILLLKEKYPFIETGIAGKSVLNKNLYYIRLGKGPDKVFYNGAHHALEWITALLLMKFTENILHAYSYKKYINGYDICKLWDASSIYIIPMVNPDGVDLVLGGQGNLFTRKSEDPAHGQYYSKLPEWNNTGLPFSEVWKANIRGVDLNLNYPANWDRAKAMESKFGVCGPAPVRYAGPAPLSEPESSALVNFTRQHGFRLVIAFHTQGSEIYWNYFNFEPPEALRIGRLFAEASGYSLAETAPEDSYAGFKDWFILEFRRPGYTVEAGFGKNPLPLSQFDLIYRENEGILLLGAAVKK